MDADTITDFLRSTHITTSNADIKAELVLGEEVDPLSDALICDESTKPLIPIKPKIEVEDDHYAQEVETDPLADTDDKSVLMELITRIKPDSDCNTFEQKCTKTENALEPIQNLVGIQEKSNYSSREHLDSSSLFKLLTMKKEKPKKNDEAEAPTRRRSGRLKTKGYVNMREIDDDEDIPHSKRRGKNKSQESEEEWVNSFITSSSEEDEEEDFLEQQSRNRHHRIIRPSICVAQQDRQLASKPRKLPGPSNKLLERSNITNLRGSSNQLVQKSQGSQLQGHSNQIGQPLELLKKMLLEPCVANQAANQTNQILQKSTKRKGSHAIAPSSHKHQESGGNVLQEQSTNLSQESDGSQTEIFSCRKSSGNLMKKFSQESDISQTGAASNHSFKKPEVSQEAVCSKQTNFKSGGSQKSAASVHQECRGSQSTESSKDLETICILNVDSNDCVADQDINMADADLVDRPQEVSANKEISQCSIPQAKSSKIALLHLESSCENLQTPIGCSNPAEKQTRNHQAKNRIDPITVHNNPHSNPSIESQKVLLSELEKLLQKNKDLHSIKVSSFQSVGGEICDSRSLESKVDEEQRCVLHSNTISVTSKWDNIEPSIFLQKVDCLEKHKDSILCQCLLCQIKAKKVTSNYNPIKILPTKRFKCNKCDKSYIRKQSLHDHLDSHSVVPKYFCDKCPKSYFKKSILEEHLFRVHSKKSYKCTQCSKIYNCSQSLRRHVAGEHSFEKYSMKKLVECVFCEKKYTHMKTMQLHVIETHSTKEEFICEHCSVVFFSKQKLKSHISMKHLPPSLKCSECSKMFFTSSQRKSHLLKNHCIGKSPSYLCELCGKEYKLKKAVDDHKRIHTGELPFCCEECGKRFRTDTNLYQHARTHSDIRQYTCHLCSMRFKIKHHLRQHMATHGMESTTKYEKRHKI